MIFIFSTSNKPSSRLIRWGLNSEVSHFAIAEANICDAYVIDSTFKTGVELTQLHNFRYDSKIVYMFEIKTIDNKKSHELFNRLYQSLKNKNYDRKAIAFLSIVILFCRKLFRRELPIENKWADKNDYYCTEVALEIKDELKLYGDIELKESQMLTPDILLKKFKDQIRLGNKNIIELKFGGNR